MSDAPPPGGYQPPQPPQPPSTPGYQPPAQPPYQPPAQPAYQAPGEPAYQQPGQPAYQQPGQFQPVNPNPSSSGNGCLKAFLIIAGISVVLGIIAVIAAVVLGGAAINEVNTQIENNFGVANAEDYEVVIESCTVSEFGLVEASGTITNKDTARHAYSIEADFFDPGASDLKLGGSTTYTSGLNQDQSEAWSVTTSASGDPTEVECVVSEVSYFGT